MSFFKHYKKYYRKLKWSFNLFSIILINVNFRELFLSNILQSSNLKNLEEQIRKLLSLNPAWARGHFLLARVSLALFENTKNNFYKGSIRLSKDAVFALNGPKDFLILIEAMYLFCNKQYEELNEKLIDCLNKGLFLNSNNYNVVFELLGSSTLIVGTKSEAKDFFEKIQENQRTKEIKDIIKFLNT